MTDRDPKDDSFNMFRQLNEMSRENLSYLSGTLPPFASALAKWNLEMLRFSTQRAVEYREFSERMAQCRSPMDVWAEQKRFFEHMQSEYAEEMGRLLELLNGISKMPPETGEQAETTSQPKPERGPAPSEAASMPGAMSEAAGQTAQAARDMAGTATAAAQHVTDEARAAVQQMEDNAPGKAEAQAAINVAETAANTIARQAEATAALLSGGAAAMGGAMAGAAQTRAASNTDQAEADESTTEDNDSDAEADEADVTGAMISEPALSSFSGEDSQDDADETTEVEDESQTAEGMISEAGYEEAAEEDDGGPADASESEDTSAAADKDEDDSHGTSRSVAGEAQSDDRSD